jgi:hypothetical protein
VSIFLTELSSRHSVMTKQKIFKDKPRTQSNSGKLTNWLTTGTSDQPVVINELTADPIVIEEDNEDAVKLGDIPEAPERLTRPKRSRSEVQNEVSESDEENLFVPETAANKRSKTGATPADAEVIEDEVESQDDKKKLGLNTSYEGFSIYGRILCLVVKRRGARNAAGGAAAPVSSQQMLENWVSTQAAGQTGDDDEDNG